MCVMGKPSILMQCKQSIFQSCLLHDFCGKRLCTEVVVSLERGFQVYLELNTVEYLQVFVTSHILDFWRVLVHSAYQKTAVALLLLAGPCAWGHCLYAGV